MKKFFIVVLVFVICSGFTFGLDAGKVEVKTGFSNYMLTTYWNNDGESTALSTDPAIMMIPFKVSYGITDSLEAAVIAAYLINNEDFGDVSGISQPAVKLKFMSEYDFGSSVTIVLPFGSEDVVGTDPEMSMLFYALYEPTFGPVDLESAVSYYLSFEGNDNQKQDSISISAKPTYSVTESFGVSLRLFYSINFERVVNGTAVSDSDGFEFTITPGVDYDINDMVNAALAVPVDIIGRNALGGWKIALDITFSL